jgi:hypothetical protein
LRGSQPGESPRPAVVSEYLTGLENSAFELPLVEQSSNPYQDPSKSRTRANGGASARDHPLYHNVFPHADGLYHCPWEGESCGHRPEKLKCNYE